MNAVARGLALAGALAAVLAVLLGAFGAHGLKGRLSPELFGVYQTAVQYHFYHALGLFAVAWVATQTPESVLAKWAGIALVAGIVLFSGSLYGLSLTGVRWLGAITPLGGLAFIAGWLLAAAALWTARG